MAMKLYHHPVSTCSQKVRIALAEKNKTIDQHIINWGIVEHLSDWYLAINPNGVVPALVHNGRAIVDSSVICEYVDEVFEGASLTPADPADRAQMRAWMRFFEEVPTVAIRAPSFNKLFVKALKQDKTAEQFDAMTNKMPLRKHFYLQMTDQGFPQQLVDESLEKLRKSLVRVSDALEKGGGPYILGKQFTIADIVLIPTVVRMSDLGLAHIWQDLPRIQAWFDAIQARPSFDTAYVPGSRVNPANYEIGQGVPEAKHVESKAS